MTPIQLKLAGAAAIVLVIAGLAGWGLYWRGEYRELKVVNVVLVDQVTVLGSSVAACNAGVEAAKTAGQAALASSRAMLAEARRLHAGGTAQVARIEALLEKPTPPGAGCDEAWAAIEAQRKAGAPR